MKMKQNKPDDWDSDRDGPWEDERESEKPTEDEPLFIGSDMSDSQLVAPTRGRGKAANTKKASAPKKAAPPRKAPARGRGKKVVESEGEEEEEEEGDEDEDEDDDMVMDYVLDDDEDMNVDEDEDEVVPVKTTAYVLLQRKNRHLY